MQTFIDKFLSLINWNSKGIIVAEYVCKITGIVGIVSGFLISSVPQYKGELPLGDIQGFVVDSSGNIYVGTGFNTSIVAYDSAGGFLRSWRVESVGGAFRMGIDKDQHVQAFTVRNDRQLTYDHQGLLINQQEIPGIYAKSPKYDRRFTRENGQVYEQRGLLRTRIVKSGRQAETIVSQNILLELLKGPRSALLFAFGVLLFSLRKRYFRKKFDA